MKETNMASSTMGQYPEQLIAMVSTETKEFLKAKAAETKRSLSAVTRDYLEAGIDGENEAPTIKNFTLDPSQGDHIDVQVSEPTRPPRTFY